jgi:hypothetical protein
VWSAKVGNPMKPQSDFPMRSPVDHQPHISTPGGARYKWPRSQSWRCQRVSPVLKASQDGVGKCPDVSHHPNIGDIYGYNLQQIRLFWWCSKSPNHGTFTKAWYLDGICGMMWNGSAVPFGSALLETQLRDFWCWASQIRIVNALFKNLPPKSHIRMASLYWMQLAMLRRVKAS